MPDGSSGASGSDAGAQRRERGDGSRRALVTGGTSGIGRAVARSLACRGYLVGIAARSEEAVRALASEIQGVPLPCDVSDAGQVERAVTAFVREAGGPPDVVVTCAGAFSIQEIGQLALEEIDRHLEVNLKGSMLVAREVVGHMREARSGILVQVGSVAGRKPFRGNAAYAASKYGLRGFHEVLREELKGTGIRVTLLEPAATDTPLWDSLDPDADSSLPDRSEMLRPEEVAEAVIFVIERPPGVQVPYLPIERVVNRRESGDEG